MPQNKVNSPVFFDNDPHLYNIFSMLLYTVIKTVQKKSLFSETIKFQIYLELASIRTLSSRVRNFEVSLYCPLRYIVQ